MSHEPARIGRIEHLAGRSLTVGEPATFCLVFPAETWTADPEQRHSLSRKTPFAGRRMHARVAVTFLAGRVTHGERPA